MRDMQQDISEQPRPDAGQSTLIVSSHGTCYLTDTPAYVMLCSTCWTLPYTPIVLEIGSARRMTRVSMRLRPQMDQTDLTTVSLVFLNVSTSSCYYSGPAA